jgi:hypothetical protein
MARCHDKTDPQYRAIRGVLIRFIRKGGLAQVADALSFTAGINADKETGTEKTEGTTRGSYTTRTLSIMCIMLLTF